MKRYSKFVGADRAAFQASGRAVHMAVLRERLEATRRQARQRSQLLDRASSLETLIDARSAQLAQHIAEYDDIQRQLEVEG